MINQYLVFEPNTLAKPCIIMPFILMLLNSEDLVSTNSRDAAHLTVKMSKGEKK